MLKSLDDTNSASTSAFAFGKDPWASNPQRNTNYQSQNRYSNRSYHSNRPCFNSKPIS